MNRMKRHFTAPARFVSVALALLACTSAESENAGVGGAGGGSLPPPSERPSCTSSTPPTGGTPPARADTAAALSSDSRTMVMFGGDVATVICGDIPKRQHVGDTWVLDTACGGWSDLSAKVGTAAPSPRARHAMALDVARGRALLFGGRFRSGDSGDYTLYNDVWAFEFATESWSLVAAMGTAPSPRANTAIAVDGDTLYAFGGNTSKSGLSFVPTNDLFALDLVSNAWSAVAAGGVLPAPREFHAMAVDASEHRVYVAHGADENALLGPFFSDAHVFDAPSASWHPLAAAMPAAAPEGRIKGGLALRAHAGEPRQLLFVGGHDDGALGNRNDVLALDVPEGADLATLGPLTWQARIAGDALHSPANGQCDFPADFVTLDTTSVERRSAFAFAPTASGEAFVVFAGDSDCGRLNDAWWFDTRSGEFTPIQETLPGLTCPRTGSSTCAGLCG